MQSILLNLLLYRNSEYMGIDFDKNIFLEKFIRNLPGVRCVVLK